MRLLPHRFPFLLVDRVVDCVPGDHIRGYKNVTRNEPFFPHPCLAGAGMPQPLVIEALAQISVILAFKTLRLEPSGEELMFFAGIDDARFASHAHPGEQLSLASRITRIRQNIGWFKAEATVGDRGVVSVSMLAALKGG